MYQLWVQYRLSDRTLTWVMEEFLDSLVEAERWINRSQCDPSCSEIHTWKLIRVEVLNH